MRPQRWHPPRPMQTPLITEGFAMPTIDEARFRTTARSTTMTCALDGHDHLVEDQSATAGLVAGHGEYVAVCGHVVTAAPMVTPSGPPCFGCNAARRCITERSRKGLRRITALLLRQLPRSRSAATEIHRKETA